MQGLHCTMWDVSLQHVDSSCGTRVSVVAAPGLSCSVAWAILVPWLGIEPHLQGGFLTAGPPGKSWTQLILNCPWHGWIKLANVRQASFPWFSWSFPSCLSTYPRTSVCSVLWASQYSGSAQEAARGSGNLSISKTVSPQALDNFSYWDCPWLWCKAPAETG